MIDKTDFLLYGGAVLAGALVIFLGYRLFYKKSVAKPKNHVADSINDFYATQDKQDSHHSDSPDSSSGGDSSGD